MTEAIDLNNARRVIKEAHDKIRKLESEKAEIQASITEAKAPVKALGIKMKDFNAARRLADLEEQERDESLDNLRTCFQALGIGQQGNLFPDKATKGNGKGTGPVAVAGGKGTTKHTPMDDDQPRPAA